MRAIATPALLGESPIRLPGGLVFVDMTVGAVRHLDLNTLADTAVHVTAGQPTYVGAVVEVSGGGFAAVTVDAIVRADGSPAPDRIATILRGRGRRLNDAAVDPRGRLWVGSVALDVRAGDGALHIWSPATGVTTVFDGMTLPNGIGWSPNGTTAYVVDSGPRVLMTARIDPATGEVGAFSELHRFTGPGEPDGLAVASDGTIWVAIWDGARIDRLSPEGDLIESIGVPVTRPTALAFGDDELFVTTARHGLTDETLAAEPSAGRVLRLPVSVAGVPSGKLIIQ